MPTIFDSFARVVPGPTGESVNLLLWDTAGQEDYDRLRPLCYPETDIFIVCFSLVHPPSAENAVTKWGPEILHHSGGGSVPVVLVGTKLDLRDDEDTCRTLANKGQKPLQYPDGLQVAKALSGLGFAHTVQYFECSALTQRGLHIVFEKAIDLAINPKKARRSNSGKGRRAGCTLL